MTGRFTAALATLVLLSSPVAASDYEDVSFTSYSKDGATIAGYLLRPETTAERAPAVIALHGCGGLFTRKGELIKRHSDWAERLAAAGYVVLLPDSFGSRDIDSICNTRERTITPRDRAADAAAAADWLAAQPFVDPERIAVLGWSNGGSTVLWSVSEAYKPKTVEWRTAIAFYPGCRLPSESPNWSPRFKPYVLIGSADNWTPAAPCRTLAERDAVLLIEYPGAVHGFDAPDTPRRTRPGVAYSATEDGAVEIGTDPKARSASIKEVMTILAHAFKQPPAEARR
jgi:dienelactone hydrolase